MAETYIQMFEEKYYPDIFFETSEKIILHFVENEEQITGKWKRILSRYMEQIVELQAKAGVGPVAEMDISFLYTTMKSGKAKFRVDSYTEGGRLFEESMAVAYLPAEWLVDELDVLAEHLTECAKKESLRRYIRPAEIEVLKLRAARSLLYHFADRFKYAIQDALDFRKLAQIKKAETFVIQIGEYMDWQKTIYAILSEVDIFNCRQGTELRFRKFPAVYYKEKCFENMDISQSKFLDCTFTDVQMKGCCFNDCIFDGCIFENTVITDAQMAGSLFIGCTLNRVEFQNTVFGGNEIDGHEWEYFEPAEFRDCTFLFSGFTNCSLPDCITLNCDAQDLKIVGGNIENAGFLGMEHVIWKPDWQEG